MDNVTQVQVAPDIIRRTNDELRRFGAHRLEGLVLWLGDVSGACATVREAIVPPQTPIQSEHGVGYLVSEATLDALNRHLHKTGSRLIAQVHSHPTRAYHSEADDRLAIATREGSLSLVVPNFAGGPADLKLWVAYRLVRGAWTKLSQADQGNLFQTSPPRKDPRSSILDVTA